MIFGICSIVADILKNDFFFLEGGQAKQYDWKRMFRLLRCLILMHWIFLRWRDEITHTQINEETDEKMNTNLHILNGA